MKRLDLPLGAVFFLFFLALNMESGILLWVTVTIALWILAARWWKYHMFQRLKAYFDIFPKRLFPGEKVSGYLILENRSFLPIMNLKVDFTLWGKMELKSTHLTAMNRKKQWTRYEGTFFVGPKKRIRIPIELAGELRGANIIRDLLLEVVDPFGIYRVEKSFHLFEEILVYPIEQELEDLTELNRMPLGDTVVKRWIQDDIFFPIGARPYQYGDAFTRIDFKATAKLQSLHTKVYDYTAHGDVCVITNLLTQEAKWMGVDEVIMERSLSIVTRLARESLQKQMRFSLFINAQMGKGLRVFELPAGLGRLHFRRTLEVLARFSHAHATPFSLALTQAKQRFPNGALTIVITPYIEEKIQQELNYLSLKGFEIYWIDPTNERPYLHEMTVGKKGVGLIG